MFRTSPTWALAALLAISGCGTGDRPVDTTLPAENVLPFSIPNQISGNEATDKQLRSSTNRFVNSLENSISPSLQQHYVDFSFDYPSSWMLTPQPKDGSASNYVRVAAPPVDGYEPFAFHVGTAYGTGNAESDRRELESSLPAIARQFGSSFDDYQVTAIGPDRVGSYNSLSWLYTATAQSINGGAPAEVYGRGDIILPAGATKGVLLLTIATDRTDEVDSPAGLAEAPTIRSILDSFQLGASGR